MYVKYNTIICEILFTIVMFIIIIALHRHKNNIDFGFTTNQYVFFDIIAITLSILQNIQSKEISVFFCFLRRTCSCEN